MRWFYLKRGNVRERALLENDVLRKMSAAGKIAQNDLLFDEAAGTSWIRASSVEGLFSAPQPQEQAQPKQPVGLKKSIEASAAKPRLVPSSKRRTSALVVTVLLFVLLCLVFTYCWQYQQKNAVWKIADKTPSVSRQPVARDTNDWIAVIGQIDQNIAKGNIQEAQRLLGQISAAFGSNEVTVALSTHLALAVLLRQLTDLEADFLAGRIDAKGEAKLVELGLRLQDAAYLRSLMSRIMGSRQDLTLPKCLSVIRTARVLKEKDLFVSAAREYIARADYTNSLSVCLDVVRLSDEAGLTAQPVVLLEKFLASHPESAAAWIELGARYCMEGRDDDALAAIKKAVKADGDKAKEKIRNDKRFDRVRDTWTYKWNVG